MHRDQSALDAAQALNRSCRCMTVDVAALRAAVEDRLRAAGLSADLAATHPHLFAQVPVFIDAAHARRMAEVVRAVEQAVALPAYRDTVLESSPQTARHVSGARGAFLGFDFHLCAEGPKLIEINTNAGGGLLAGMLTDAALACCGATPAASAGGFERQAIEMLLAEWSRTGRAGRPSAIAIIDQAPETQYLFPEFLLAVRAIERTGMRAVVAAPQDLELRGGELHARGERVDLVYNRLCDFSLEAEANRALRDAFLSNAAVVTPDPRAHALYADKRWIELLGDEAWLAHAGLDPRLAALLGESVPRTFQVRPEDSERLWQERKGLFFKPAVGFGSRGTYRGDKLTRRVFDDILHGVYVAQALVAPSQRASVSEGEAPFKLDVRNYAYAVEVQLLAARLWRGQTTNFRTEGGGFAPVFVLS